MTNTPDIWMLHTTNPREGESQWGGCYIVEADAHNDAATMRKVTGLDWEVVPMVRADSLGKCLHQIAEPAAPQAVQAAVPMFWVRLLRDGLYEGPVHNNSVGGKMLRDEKPGEWHPLYLHAAPAHPAEGVHAAVIAGAIFDFAGYLTTLPHEKALHCSEAHEASPMVEAITEWCKRRGLRTDGARVETWRAALAAQAKQGGV